MRSSELETSSEGLCLRASLEALYYGGMKARCRLDFGVTLVYQAASIQTCSPDAVFHKITFAGVTESGLPEVWKEIFEENLFHVRKYRLASNHVKNMLWQCSGSFLKSPTLPHPPKPQHIKIHTLSLGIIQVDPDVECIQQVFFPLFIIITPPVRTFHTMFLTCKVGSSSPSKLISSAGH